MKRTVDEGAITLLYYSLQYILITRNLSSSVATFLLTMSQSLSFSAPCRRCRLVERMKSLVVDLLLDIVEEPDCPYHRCSQSPTAAASAQAAEPDHRPSPADEQRQQRQHQQGEPQPHRACCSCSMPSPVLRRNKTTWRSSASRLAHQPTLLEHSLHLNPYQGLSQRTLDLLDGKDKLLK